MAKLRLALVCALGVPLLMPQAAAAGGWWSYIDLNRSYVAPGQRVEVRETVTFSSSAAAEEAQKTGRFYVYLLRGFDYSVVHRAMREPSPGNAVVAGARFDLDLDDVEEFLPRDPHP